MSSEQTTPQGLSTYEALAYQKAQQQQAEKRAAEQASFERERQEFKEEQAKAAAEGRVVTGRTTTRTEQGGTAITESVNRQALGRSNADVTLPERYDNRPLVVDLTSVTKPAIQTRTEYKEPRYNQQFGSKRVGDIINEQVSRGDKGLYAPRQTYDPKAIDRFTQEYETRGRTTRQEGAADFPILTPVRGRPFEAEGFGTYGEKVTVSTTPPIVKEVSAPSVTKAPIKDDFFEGAKGVITNTKEDFELGFFGSGIGIGALFSGITGGKTSDAQMKRFAERGSEAEERTVPEFESGLISNVGIKTLENKRLESNIMDFGKDISKAPSYYAGSAVTTAATYLSPGGVARSFRAVSAGLSARRTEMGLKEITQFGSKLSKPIGVNIEKGIVNIGTESDVSRFGVGIVRKEGISFFSREQVPKQFIVPTKDITAYTRPSVKIGTRADEQLIDVGKLPKELPASAPIARKNEQFFEKVEAIPGRDPVFLKLNVEEKPVATEQFFSFKSLKQLGSSEEGLKSFFGREDIGVRVTGTRGTGTGKPFDFPKPESQVTKQTLKDLGIVKTSEASNTDFSGLGLGKSLFSGMRQETTRARTPLGFGGATGAERKRVSVEDFGFEFETVRYPGTDKATKSFMRSSEKVSLDTRTAKAFTGAERLGGISKELAKFDNASLPKFNLGLTGATRQREDVLLLPRMNLSDLSGFRSDTIFNQTLRTTTRTIPALTTRVVPITTEITKTSSRPRLPIFDFGGDEKPQKRRKGKKGRSRNRAFTVGNPVSAVLGPSSKAGRRVGKFLDKFDFDF